LIYLLSRRLSQPIVTISEELKSAEALSFEPTPGRGSNVREIAQLQAAGLIGNENRLAWIEAIRRIQQNRKLVSASYEIEPQQAIAAEPPLVFGKYQLRGSRMRVELGMVHELDMFNFIDDLRTVGLFTVQDCEIKRNDVPAEAVGIARFTATCTLVWLTLGGAPQAAAAPINKGWP
ncbi:MAG: hypothetical protein ACLGI6_15970, partial [Gammaproteobacteria bacterium]